MAKSTRKTKKPKHKPKGYQGPRGEDGKFLPKGQPDKRTIRERLGDYESVGEKALAILAEDLYAANKSDRREAAKLLAKLNPQTKPKDVLEPRAREIVEFWVRHNVVVGIEEEWETH